MPSPDIINDLVKSLDRACRSLGFCEYMPDAMIGHYVRQVVPASFSGNRLDLTQFHQWVRKEYSVPDHVFSRVFSKINETASEMGVVVVLPDSFKPEADETVKERMKNELKEVAYSDLKDEMRNEVRDELYDEFRPEVYSEVRSRIEAEGKADPELDEKILDALEGCDQAEKSASREVPEKVPEEVPEEMDVTGMIVEPGPSEEDIRRELRERLRPEVEDDLYKELRPLLDKKIREELENELRPRLRVSFEKSVREELRRELGDVVREEVQEDLRTLLVPVLRSELRKELLEEARSEESGIDGSGGGDVEYAHEGEIDPESLAAAPGPESRVVDRPEFIRRVGEGQVPEVGDTLLAQTAEMARDLQEQERIKRLEELARDPRYCLEKIGEFIFPDQPDLWKKVAPLVEPDEWASVVLALEEETSPLHEEKLARSRGIIREALELKAEILEEAGYTPRNMDAGGEQHSRTVKKVLAGADEFLDFTLKSICDILGEADPAEAAGQH